MLHYMVYSKMKIENTEQADQAFQAAKEIAENKDYKKHASFFWEEGEELDDEMGSLLGCKNIQEMINWMQNNAWDLWSIELGIPFPVFDKVMTPEVPDGPIFNMMVWEEGYAVGVALALFEYLTEKDDWDWGRWDT